MLGTALPGFDHAAQRFACVIRVHAVRSILRDPRQHRRQVLRGQRPRHIAQRTIPITHPQGTLVGDVRRFIEVDAIDRVGIRVRGGAEQLVDELIATGIEDQGVFWCRRAHRSSQALLKRSPPRRREALAARFVGELQEYVFGIGRLGEMRRERRPPDDEVFLLRCIVGQALQRALRVHRIDDDGEPLRNEQSNGAVEAGHS